MMSRFLAPVLSARFMTPMTSIPALILELTSSWSLSCPPPLAWVLVTCLQLAMLFSPAVGPLFLPAVGPLFCHPSRCSGPQASSPARRQSSVLDRASGFLSPASSSLVVFASRVRVVWRSPSTTHSSPRAARVESVVFSRSCNATLLSRVLLLRSSWHSMIRPPWHSMALRRRFTRALVSTSCLLVHVLTHVFSSARFSRARLLWLVVVLVGLLD